MGERSGSRRSRAGTGGVGSRSGDPPCRHGRLLRLGGGARRPVAGRAAGDRRGHRGAGAWWPPAPTRPGGSGCIRPCRRRSPVGCARRRCSSTAASTVTSRRATSCTPSSSSVTPLVEGISLDEAFLDVTGSQQLLGDGPTIAAAIRRRVADELAPDLLGGRGPHQADGQAGLEGGQAHRRPGPASPRAPAWWWSSPTGSWSSCTRFRSGPVGSRAGHRSAARGAGHHDHRRPRRASVRSAASGCSGTAQGAHLAALARGHDPRPVVPDQEAKSIGHEETFPSDLWDRAVLRDHLLRMVDASATALRRSGLAARTVNVKIRFADFTMITRVPLADRRRSTPRRPSARWPTALLDSVELDRGVRLLGVSLSGFGDAAGEPPAQPRSRPRAGGGRPAGRPGHGACSIPTGPVVRPTGQGRRGGRADPGLLGPR